MVFVRRGRWQRAISAVLAGYWRGRWQRAMSAVLAGYMLWKLWRLHRTCKETMRHWYAGFEKLVDPRARDRWNRRLRDSAEAQVAMLSADQVAHFPAELDVVLSGGGMRCFYGCGVALFLDALCRIHGKGRVIRWAGTSGGGAVAHAAHVGDLASILRFAEISVQALRGCPMGTLPTAQMWHTYFTWAAAAAVQPPPGRLHLSLTKVRLFPWPWLQNVIVSEFVSSSDMADALVATQGLPLLTIPGLVKAFRGIWAVDGGVTNNLPAFRDRVRPQMLLRHDQLPARFGGLRRLMWMEPERVRELVQLGMCDAQCLVANGAVFDFPGDESTGPGMVAAEEGKQAIVSQRLELQLLRTVALSRATKQGYYRTAKSCVVVLYF